MNHGAVWRTDSRRPMSVDAERSRLKDTRRVPGGIHSVARDLAVSCVDDVDSVPLEALPVRRRHPGSPFRNSGTGCEIQRVLLEGQVRPTFVNRRHVRPKCRCPGDAFLGRDVVKDDVIADDGHDRVEVVAEPPGSIPLDKDSYIGAGHNSDSERSEGMRLPAPPTGQPRRVQ